MIEKFNFYDVYGYFLPGVALLAILWVPFGLISGKLPPSDWSSALIAAAIAYILGHLLQNVATNAIPSRRTKGKERYPSDYYLDPEDTELPKAIKGKIAELVESQFGLDLEIEKNGDQPASHEKTTIDKVRNNAFRLARQILIQGKAVSYAEQFQGMYSLTRGLFSVFALACAYWLGWFFASLKNKTIVSVAVILLGTLIPVLIALPILRDKKSKQDEKHRFELGYAWGLVGMLLLIGYLAGVHSHATWNNSAILALLATSAFLASWRCKGAYDYFAGLFASTVWRDYLAYNIKSANPSSQLSGEE